MNTHWNDVRVIQVTGRGYRTGAHKHFPEDERVIYNYKYLSTIEEGMRLNAAAPVKYEKLSSDEFIDNVSVRKRVLIDAFQDAIQKSAIDCRYWQNGPCYKPKTLSSTLVMILAVALIFGKMLALEVSSN